MGTKLPRKINSWNFWPLNMTLSIVLRANSERWLIFSEIYGQEIWLVKDNKTVFVNYCYCSIIYSVFSIFRTTLKNWCSFPDNDNMHDSKILDSAGWVQSEWRTRNFLTFQSDYLSDLGWLSQSSTKWWPFPRYLNNRWWKSSWISGRPTYSKYFDFISWFLVIYTCMQSMYVNLFFSIIWYHII